MVRTLKILSIIFICVSNYKCINFSKCTSCCTNKNDDEDYYATEDFGRFQQDGYSTIRSDMTRFNTSQFQTARSATPSGTLSMNRQKKRFAKYPSLDSFDGPMPDIEIADYTEPNELVYNEYNSPCYYQRR